MWIFDLGCEEIPPPAVPAPWEYLQEGNQSQKSDQSQAETQSPRGLVHCASCRKVGCATGRAGTQYHVRRYSACKAAVLPLRGQSREIPKFWYASTSRITSQGCSRLCLKQLQSLESCGSSLLTPFPFLHCSSRLKPTAMPVQSSHNLPISLGSQELPNLKTKAMLATYRWAFTYNLLGSAGGEMLLSRSSSGYEHH